MEFIEFQENVFWINKFINLNSELEKKIVKLMEVLKPKT